MSLVKSVQTVVVVIVSILVVAILGRGFDPVS